MTATFFNCRCGNKIKIANEEIETVECVQCGAKYEAAPILLGDINVQELLKYPFHTENDDKKAVLYDVALSKDDKIILIFETFEYIKKTAARGGSSGRIYVPPKWIGHEVIALKNDS